MHVEAVAPTAPSRAVVINVGEHTGALVLASSESRSGIEVEIHPVSEPQARTHVWVLPREAPVGVVYAAVFPSLASGDYAILALDGSIARSSPYRRIRSRTPPGCSERRSRARLGYCAGPDPNTTLTVFGVALVLTCTPP